MIDEEQDLVFDSEEKVFSFFEEPIQRVESIYQNARRKDDFSDSDQIPLEVYLDSTLTDPDEIWVMN